MNSEIYTLTFFHGEGKTAEDRQGDFRSRPPSPLKPIWATPILENATGYGMDRLYVLFLNPKAKAFDFSTDLKRLYGRTYFSDTTLDMLDRLYKTYGFSLWDIEHDEEKLAYALNLIHGKSENVFGKNSQIFSNIEDILSTSKSPFLHVFNHLFPDESYIGPRLRDGCRYLNGFFRQYEFKSVTDGVFGNNENKFKGIGKPLLLLARMISETIDAMATGKYPLEILSFRKVLIQGVADLGFQIILDVDSDFVKETEVGIIDPAGIDKIMNVPLFSDGKPTNETMKRLNDALSEIDSFGEKPVSRPEFENLLEKIKMEES